MSTTLPVTKTLENELVAAYATIERLKAGLTPGQKDAATIVELKALVHTLGASEVNLLARVATLEQENATLQASVGDIDTIASRKALDICAGQGVPALRLDRGDGIRALESGGRSVEELYAAYNAITDPMERGKFFAKNEAAMMKKD